MHPFRRPSFASFSQFKLLPGPVLYRLEHPNGYQMEASKFTAMEVCLSSDNILATLGQMS